MGMGNMLHFEFHRADSMLIIVIADNISFVRQQQRAQSSEASVLAFEPVQPPCLLLPWSWPLRLSCLSVLGHKRLVSCLLLVRVQLLLLREDGRR